LILSLYLPRESLCGSGAVTHSKIGTYDTGTSQEASMM